MYPHCRFPQITSFSNFFSGDPYIGTNRDEIKKKNERIAELEKELKRMKSEAGRTSYSKGREFPRSETAEDKKRRYNLFSCLHCSTVTLASCVSLAPLSSSQLSLCRTCRDWNESGCDKKGAKAGHCGFGGNVRKHGCAKILDQGSICWATDHQEKDCTK